MDARLVRAAILAAAFFSMGAGYRTPNFVVNAPSPQMAEQIGKQAEDYRRDLAILWLGSPLPNWGQPCPITAQVAENLGAGGATSFMFDGGEVYGWQMSIQGSLERILDSVLPHEVTHTIFASHFRRPLPRWADEGACTTVEHASERTKQQQMLISFLKTDRGIPFHSMFAMKEYPQDVLPLYAQGHSLASYLIQQGGRQKFLNFVAAGLAAEQWPTVTKKFYGFSDLAQLQNNWLDWVRKGSPAIKPTKPADDVQLAGASQRKRPEPNLIYRGQSSDTPDAKPAPSRLTDNLVGGLVPVTRPQALGQAPSPYALAAADARPTPGMLDQAPNFDARPGPVADPRSAGPYSARPPEPDSADAGSQRVILEWDRHAEDSRPQRAAVAEPTKNSSVYMTRNSQPVAAE